MFPPCLALALSAAVLLAGRPGLSEEGPTTLQEPYQIEGTARMTDTRYGPTDDPATAPPLYLVYLGDAEDDPQPLLEDHRQITLIGRKSAASAQLVDIEKHCRFLCGDEGEACHYVGLYRLEKPGTRLGEAIAALQGRWDITDLKGPEKAADKGPALEVTSQSHGLLYPREPNWEPALVIERWNEAEGLLAMTMRVGEEAYPVEGGQCEVRTFGPDLASITCGGFALVFGNEGPLVLSYPDYNRPLAEIAASFSYEGRSYYLVNLGLKAQDATGLLFHNGASWQLRLRPRTTPNLC
jgi:hypothetical protein